VGGASLASAVRGCVRNRNVLWGIPLFFVAVPWWLCTGAGFLWGLVAGWLQRS